MTKMFGIWSTKLPEEQKFWRAELSVAHIEVGDSKTVNFTEFTFPIGSFIVNIAELHDGK